MSAISFWRLGSRSFSPSISRCSRSKLFLRFRYVLLERSQIARRGRYAATFGKCLINRNLTDRTNGVVLLRQARACFRQFAADKSQYLVPFLDASRNVGQRGFLPAKRVCSSRAVTAGTFQISRDRSCGQLYSFRIARGCCGPEMSCVKSRSHCWLRTTAECACEGGACSVDLPVEPIEFRPNRFLNPALFVFLLLYPDFCRRKRTDQCPYNSKSIFNRTTANRRARVGMRIAPFEMVTEAAFLIARHPCKSRFPCSRFAHRVWNQLASNHQ